MSLIFGMAVSVLSGRSTRRERMKATPGKPSAVTSPEMTTVQSNQFQPFRRYDPLPRTTPIATIFKSISTAKSPVKTFSL